MADGWILCAVQRQKMSIAGNQIWDFRCFEGIYNRKRPHCINESIRSLTGLQKPSRSDKENKHPKINDPKWVFIFVPS